MLAKKRATAVMGSTRPKVTVTSSRFLGLLTLAVVPWNVSAADDPGEVALYFFEQGTPVEGVEVRFDNGPRGASDDDGEVLLTVDPGKRVFSLRRDALRLGEERLTVLPGETYQYIFTLGSEGIVSADYEGRAEGTKAVAQQPAQPAATPGTVRGRVVSAEDDTGVAGARVYVRGSTVEAVTDAAGEFELQLPAGTHTLSVIHTNFSTQTIDAVETVSDTVTEQRVALTPIGLALDEFVVVAPYIEGSVASAIAEQRDTSEVLEVLGAEQMSKAGDGDAADALKRATGLTIEDGKYVVVRGQPSRYTLTLWNGSALPSPDPNRRIVPLDLFPTGILRSISVQKTYSPDRPGGFAGGLIALNTKGLPEESFATFAASVGLDTQATGKEGYSYEGGGSDWLGIDDGTRALPDAVDAATAGGTQNLQSDLRLYSDDPQLETLGQSFENNWQVEKETLPPDASFDVAAGERFQTSRGEYGVLFSAGYSSGNEIIDGPENQYQQSSNGQLVAGDTYTTSKTETETSLGGMLTLGGEWGDDHAVTSNTFLIQSTLDRTEYKEGLSAENDQYRKEYTLEWVERSLLAQQFVGEHLFDSLGDLGLTWRYLIAESTRDSPDRRFYRYTLAGGEYVFEESSPIREFQELTDDTDSYGVDLELPVLRGEKLGLVAKAGFSASNKERESSTLAYKYRWQPGEDPPTELLLNPNPEVILAADNIGPNGWYLSDLTDPSQRYTGTQDVAGYYLMVDASLYEKFRLVAGLRQETGELTVESFGKQTVLETDDVLPGATLTWFMNDNMQLRAGVSRTVARPELNELSSTYYYDADTGDKYQGNPELESAYINGYDLRWEWYPSNSSTVTAGVFYKDFENPIEVVWIPYATDDRRSFENADAAEVYGMELGAMTDLTWFGEWGKAFSMGANLALTDSSVTLADSDADRPLQGQAPYVVNLQAGYSGERHEANLLFNMVGERLDQVGEAFGTTKKPDVYLQPIPQLDFVWRYKWGSDVKVSFGAENLLDPTIEYLQDDEVYRSYHKGREFEIGLEISL